MIFDSRRRRFPFFFQLALTLKTFFSRRPRVFYYISLFDEVRSFRWKTAGAKMSFKILSHTKKLAHINVFFVLFYNGTGARDVLSFAHSNAEDIVQ